MSKTMTVDTFQQSKNSATDALYYLAKAQRALEEQNLFLVAENLIQAHLIEPGEIEILASLADIQFKLGHWQQSLITIKTLINLQPDEIKWRVHRLAALHGCKAYGQTIEEALLLLDTYPNEQDILYNLASAYYQSESFTLGLRTIETLIDLYPSDPEYLVMRGLIYRSMGDQKRSKTDLLKAESLGGNTSSLFTALGALYSEISEPQIALDYCSKALDVNQQPSQVPHIALNAAFCAMSLGDFDKAWEFYAYRKGAHVIKEASYPAWQGENLSGKHLVVRREQGLGDEVRFASLIPEIANEAGSLTLECDSRLIELYQRSFSHNVALVGTRATDSETEHGNSYVNVNYAAHIGDLAQYKRRSLDDFPEHYGYLQPDSERVSYWSDYLAKLGGQLNVGVTWKSGNTKGMRSTFYTNIKHWLPVFSIEGINFVNLYYGDCEEELKWVEAQIGVKIHTPKGINLKNDLDELSALMASLDLVVGPHTATVDLAMAVKGASAWLLPFESFSNTHPFYFGQAYFPWAPAAKPVLGDGFEETMDIVVEELSHIAQTTDPKLTLAELSTVMYACYVAS